MHVFCASLYIPCCSIVTWWGGPGGIEAWPLLHSCFDTVGYLTHNK